MKVINLSSHSLSLEETQVLSLGLSFYPTAEIDRVTVIKDLNLFARKILLCSMFDKSPNPEHKLSMRECKDLHDLTLLHEESHSAQSSDAAESVDSVDLIDKIDLEPLLSNTKLDKSIPSPTLLKKISLKMSFNSNRIPFFSLS